VNASGPPGGPDLVPALVRLVDRARTAGIDASPDRVHAFVAALGVLGVGDPMQVRWAGAITLCGDPLDVRRWERLVAELFGGTTRPRSPRTIATIRPVPVADEDGAPPDPGAGDEAGDEELSLLNVEASRHERLRHRDIELLTDDERADLARLLTRVRLPGETRSTRRWSRSRAGAVDRPATVRRLLAAGGEPAALARRRHRTRPRDVVLLVDVSGSMTAHADALLRFAHATVRGRAAGTTEVFTLGTRLTRVTRELSIRDPDPAMRAIGRTVADWSGGTRLGETLRSFLDEWGQRGTARGAVVVIMSDGWERGGVELLTEQVARLSRLAHRIVWANPRAGRTGFAPTAGGMAACLPFCDDLVPVTDLAGLETLAEVVAGRQRSAWRGEESHAASTP
jgi:uncharacterized protein with von Willebrand factor type A (vWA) domain